jgi:hypothetical protein
MKDLTSYCCLPPVAACCRTPTQITLLSATNLGHSRAEQQQLARVFEADAVYLPSSPSAAAAVGAAATEQQQQQQLYKAEVSGLVDSLYAGVNSAVLAYGEF